MPYEQLGTVSWSGLLWAQSPGLGSDAHLIHCQQVVVPGKHTLYGVCCTKEGLLQHICTNAASVRAAQQQQQQAASTVALVEHAGAVNAS